MRRVRRCAAAVGVVVALATTPMDAAIARGAAGLPADACGGYYGDDGAFMALVNVGGRPVLLSKHSVVAVGLERTTGGLRLHLLPPAANHDNDDDNDNDNNDDVLPPTLTLVAPRAGGDRWTMGRLRQWRDPVATRLLTA